MDGSSWQWVVGVSITVAGLIVGGVWALVQLVAKLVSEATALKVRLDLVVPIAQEMPTVKQNQAIHEHRLKEVESDIADVKDDVDRLKTKVTQ